MSNNYDGWELNFFDQAKNFRDYQWNIIKNKVRKKILEVGPGNCVFLPNYRKISNKIYLYEPSKKLRSKLNIKIKKLNNVKLINKYDKLKYDTIIYLDVIEHIKNDKKEILSAFKRLKKNGHLIVNVPAFQLLYTDYDRRIGHFRRYTKSSFKKILENLNIKNFEMTYFDSIGFFLILFSKYLKMSNKVNFKNSVKIWNILVPLSKILDIFLGYFIGKSLMIIIKKN